MATINFDIMEQHDVPIKETEYNDTPVSNNSTYTPSPGEFSRKVLDTMTKQVKLTDSSNGLDLFCYIKCDVTDSETLKKCRGVVFNNDEIVMNGFPYTYEYTEENNEDISNTFGDPSVFEKCSFYDSYEGSLIRMFYFDGKWYTSTNRKLDANKSKWSSVESFGYFFKQALESEYKINERLRDNISPNDSVDIVERFQNILDKTKQYMFLLLNNNENRIVCTPPENPTVFHVGTFINGVLSMDEDIYVSYPKKHNFKDLGELYDYVNDVDIYTKQGVIIFVPGNVQCKIFNKKYRDYYHVRGNEPSVKFRYLQVRMDKRYNNLLHFIYPTFSKVFDDYENTIYDIAKNIHKCYFDRFIRNMYIKVPQEEYKVIRACHDWHLENRFENKISLNKVIDLLNLQQPTSINKMIRRYFMEKKEALKVSLMTNEERIAWNENKNNELVAVIKTKKFLVRQKVPLQVEQATV